VANKGGLANQRAEASRKQIGEILSLPFVRGEYAPPLIFAIVLI
jgi:hypothetical protein